MNCNGIAYHLISCVETWFWGTISIPLSLILINQVIHVILQMIVCQVVEILKIWSFKFSDLLKIPSINFANSSYFVIISFSVFFTNFHHCMHNWLVFIYLIRSINDLWIISEIWFSSLLSFAFVPELFLFQIFLGTTYQKHEYTDLRTTIIFKPKDDFVYKLGKSYKSLNIFRWC